MMMMVKMFMKVAIFHVDPKEKSALSISYKYNSHCVYCGHCYHQYNKIIRISRNNR